MPTAPLTIAVGRGGCQDALPPTRPVSGLHVSLWLRRRGPHQPSLSAAFTLTPKSSRNLTMWWWPAQTALCSGVMPSSLGLLGSSTWDTGHG